MNSGQFKPGQSGNPQGLRYREASEALRVAVTANVARGKNKGTQKLRRICEKIASAAMKGEPWACCMVFDRLDGKAHQSVDSTVTLEAGQVFVDLMRALNDRRNATQQAMRTIEHKPTANGANGSTSPAPVQQATSKGATG